MDTACLDHRLTAAERAQFEKQGFLIVKDVIPAAKLDRLAAAADRIDHAFRPKYELTPHQPLNLLDERKDDEFLDLLDWPRTIAKVVDILGWHIQLYHSHLIVTPPREPGYRPKTARLGWHQDSGRLNIDIESNPRPRISLKVGFFFSSTAEPNRGNFHVVPGSHLQNALDLPADESVEHPDAVPICADAGDAVFFDRRIWHAGGINTSDVTRKVLFLGYSYRWLKPRDDMTVAHYMEGSDPIRQQLLGASPNGGFGFTSPSDEDVPLKAWWAEHVGEEAVVP